MIINENSKMFTIYQVRKYELINYFLKDYLSHLSIQTYNTYIQYLYTNDSFSKVCVLCILIIH